MNQHIAQHLLEIDAVILSPNKPFTWSSGMKSPIYCDNRLTMSYPEIRREIARTFKDLIEAHYPDVELIAGTSTAGIPHAAWVSELMNLPMVYVRGNAKNHGKKNQVEGLLHPGQKVVILEDLISTGQSTIATAEGLRHEGGEVLGAASIFTYGLEKGRRALRQADIPIASITDFTTLLGVSKLSGREQERLNQWFENPESDAWKYENSL